MMIVEGRFEYKRDADDFIPEWRVLFALDYLYRCS